MDKVGGTRYRFVGYTKRGGIVIIHLVAIVGMVQFLDLGDGRLAWKGTGKHQPVLCEVMFTGLEPQDQKTMSEDYVSSHPHCLLAYRWIALWVHLVYFLSDKSDTRHFEWEKS